MDLAKELVGTDLALYQFVGLAEAVDTAKPKTKDLEALRRLFDEHRDRWQMFGDLGRTVEGRLIRQSTSSKSAEMIMENEATQLKRQLGWQTAPVLERLLIQECVLAHLNLLLTSYGYVGVQAESMTHERAAFWEKRLSAAQARFLKASTTLARVRRLALPTLQLNIGAPQSAT